MTHRARPPQLCSAQTTSAARQRRTVAVIFVYKMIKFMHKTSYKCIKYTCFQTGKRRNEGGIIVPNNRAKIELNVAVKLL
jgi:hypothetical protein